MTALVPFLLLKQVHDAVYATDVGALLLGTGGFVLVLVGAVLTCTGGVRRGLGLFLLSALTITGIYVVHYGTSSLRLHPQSVVMVLGSFAFILSGGLSLITIGVLKESVV